MHLLISAYKEIFNEVIQILNDKNSRITSGAKIQG